MSALSLHRCPYLPDASLLMGFLKSLFEKVDFEKNQQMTKNMLNYPVGNELNKFCTYVISIIIRDFPRPDLGPIKK